MQLMASYPADLWGRLSRIKFRDPCLNHSRKIPPFEFQPTGWRLAKMSIDHILGYTGWLWSDEMNNRTAFAKVPNGWTQIEHNHHCGDDLVFLTKRCICNIVTRKPSVRLKQKWTTPKRYKISVWWTWTSNKNVESTFWMTPCSTLIPTITLPMKSSISQPN